jgi:hypothetical protein
MGTPGFAAQYAVYSRCSAYISYRVASPRGFKLDAVVRPVALESLNFIRSTLRGFQYLDRPYRSTANCYRACITQCTSPWRRDDPCAANCWLTCYGQPYSGAS